MFTVIFYPNEFKYLSNHINFENLGVEVTDKMFIKSLK